MPSVSVTVGINNTIINGITVEVKLTSIVTFFDSNLISF